MNLHIQDIHANVEDKEILKGVSLDVQQDEVHVVMGPNGSGKSTLSFVVMGHPNYEVTSGSIQLDGKEINDFSPDERSRNGLFLSFQYPSTIPGVTVSHFLRMAMNAHREEQLSIPQANKIIQQKAQELHIDTSFLERYVNDGFSGGEKKRLEILQLALLQPKIAVLDETDSGTDVDALKIIADGVNNLKAQTHMGVLLITHYDRILKLIKPDRVSILLDGKIVETGGPELAAQIEAEGYKKYK